MHKSTIWIDIDNTPHVLFFAPIIRDLKQKGFSILVTARNYGGVNSLLKKNDIKFINIGGDNGKNTISKIFNLILRILNLYFTIRKHKNISVSISHGSRAHIGASWLLRIPSITSYDYEYSSKLFVHQLATIVIVPVLLTDNYFLEHKISLKNIRKYNGYKEQVYLDGFTPDSSLLPKLGIDNNKVIVLVRPPAFSSHYFTAQSGKLFNILLETLKNQNNIHTIFSPRNNVQRKRLKEMIHGFSQITILEDEVDGLNLIWNSDLVFSGGGTMNREAALLGVPVFSIFGGKLGVLDKKLNEIGRLNFLRNIEDFSKIKFQKRNKNAKVIKGNVKDVFTNEIEKLL